MRRMGAECTALSLGGKTAGLHMSEGNTTVESRKQKSSLGKEGRGAVDSSQYGTRGDRRIDWGDDDSATPILHVDMDSFFASVEVARRPELRGQPVIVGGMGQRGVVTAATYEARVFGIRAGMPIGRARSVCPQGVFLPGDHAMYREYSRRVMGVMSRLSPQFEPVSIDEAFVDVAGARRRLGRPREIAEMIRTQIREEIGLPASVGVASVKSVAKIASAYAKPDGLLVIPASRTTDFLHSLPIGALWGVGHQTEGILRTRGIDTVGELAGVALTDLTGWIGESQGRRLHDLACGKDPREVRPRGREKSISTERTFDTNITSAAELRVFILGASHDCAARLRSAGLVGWTVTLKVRDAQFDTVTRARTLHSPTDVGREIAEVAFVLLASMLFPRGGVRLVGVGVSSLISVHEGIPATLDEDPRPRATELAMDAVRERFGVQALRPASLLEHSVSTEEKANRRAAEVSTKVSSRSQGRGNPG